MGSLTGNLKSLRASEKARLEKLIAKRSSAREVISLDLARRAAAISRELGLQLAFLIGRDGTVEHLAVGTKDRVYLPDLGRFRLDPSRLRRVRLVVFLPNGDEWLSRQRSEPLLFGSEGSRSRRSAAATVEGPEIAADLVTDLEKLRLDALLVVAVSTHGAPGAATFMHLVPRDRALDERSRGRGKGAARPEDRGLHTHIVRDLNDLDLDFSDFIEELESLITESRPRGHATGKDRAVLVGAYTGSLAEARASMEELQELARTAGIEVLDTITQRRRTLDPRTLIGAGKIEEIVLSCLDIGADMLVFDRELAPGQLRSITKLTELKVIDRSMLILDIFAQRATSSEGRLQVELAQLRYNLPRLTESDSGLSRLTGGIGGRGPGETKLEIGRRRARDRITDLERRIERLADQRALRRERRQVRGVPVVAIVGYTNAGKSTLLNALTKGNVFVENKLFATLDPSSRRMRFPNEREVIFVDTVGFIRELPKELIAAFRATLEEVGEADLLLHVVDASNPEMKRQIEIITETLDSLGFGDTPRILVLNKIDRLSALERHTVEHGTGGFPVSAVTRENLDTLIPIVQEQLQLSFTGQDPGRFTEIESVPK